MSKLFSTGALVFISILMLSGVTLAQSGVSPKAAPAVCRSEVNFLSYGPMAVVTEGGVQYRYRSGVEKLEDMDIMVFMPESKPGQCSAFLAPTVAKDGKIVELFEQRCTADGRKIIRIHAGVSDLPKSLREQFERLRAQVLVCFAKWDSNNAFPKNKK